MRNAGSEPEQGGVVQRLARRFESVFRSRTLADLLWAGSGAAAGGVLGALSSAIYARTLGVEEFGVFTLILSFVLLLASLSDLGVSGSMVRFGAESVARGDFARLRLILGYGARARIIITTTLLVAAVLLVRPILSAMGGRLGSRVEPYFLYSLATVVLLAAGQFFLPVFQMFKKFRQQAFASVSGSAVRAAILVLLVAVSASMTVGVALWIEGIVAFGFLLAYWKRAPFRSINWRPHDPELRHSMLSFNKWLSLYLVINTLGARLDVVMLGTLADARALGLYGAAMKVVSASLVMANAYLMVLIPDLASVLDREQLRRKRHNSIAISVIICAGLGVLALVSRPLVALLYGPHFEEVPSLLQVMLGGVAALVLSYPITATLYVLNRTIVSAGMACASAAVVAGLCWLLIPTLHAMGAAIAFAGGGTAATLVALGYYLLRGRRLEQAFSWDRIKDEGPVPPG